MALDSDRRVLKIELVITALVAYYFTSLIVLIGLMFGQALIPLTKASRINQNDLLSRMAQFNGQDYLEITTTGYRFEPDSRSSVAFFPAYPVLAAAVSRLGGLSAELSLIVVSNFCLALSFVLLVFYIKNRHVNSDITSAGWVCVAFGLWPTTFFMRMAYSESMFVVLVLFVLLGIKRNWPLWIIAFVAGLAAGTRPVGVAVAATVWWNVWVRPLTWWQRISCWLFIIPLSCWGLIAYMVFLQAQFGDALAFIRTQQHWTLGAPADQSISNRIISLVTFEPIWGVYDSTSNRYWGGLEPHENPLFSMMFWNPIIFLFTLITIVYCSYRGNLTSHELILGLGLLGIPYLTRAFEMSMASQARFASVVIPAYIAMGRYLERLPSAAAALVCAIMGCVLGLWAALFGSGYWFF